MHKNPKRVVNSRKPGPAVTHGHGVVQQGVGSLALAARGVSAVVANLSAACYQQGAWLLGPAWLVCLGPVCGLQAALHSRWSPATGETSRCSANVAH